MSQKRPLPPIPDKKKRRPPSEDGYEVPISKREQNIYDSIDFSNSGERRLLVSDIPAECSEDLITMYFESKRHFGKELAVEKLELDSENQQAVVTFQKAEDAKHVLETHERKPCKIHGSEVTIELYMEQKTATPAGVSVGAVSHAEIYSDDYTSVPSQSETDTIEIRGFDETTTESTLQYYFENERRSGGGDTKSFRLNREEGSMLLTFVDSSVVKRVLAKEHVVEEHKLSVRPFIISKNELILLEVTEKCTEESVQNFLEAKLKITVSSVVFSANRSKVLVQAKEEIDFNKAKEACNKWQLGGTNFVPVQIPVTNGIIVTSLPNDVTFDTITLYFENSLRSKGGDLANTEDHIADGYCLVFFKDPKVVHRVCEKKDHKILKDYECVMVKPYNAYFGLPAGCEISVFKLPDPIKLENQDTNKIQFLKSHSAHKSKLEAELKNIHAEIFWDEKPIVIECTVTDKDTAHHKGLKTWQEDVLKVIGDFTDILEIKKKSVDGELWEKVKQELNNIHLSNPDGVALIMQADTKQIVLVAHKALVDDAWREIENAVETADKKLKEFKSLKTDMRELAMWKIKYLKAAGFDQDMQAEHEGIEIQYKEGKGKGEIHVKGQKQFVDKVLISMYERLENVKCSDIHMGEEKMNILKTESTQKYLQQLMRDKHLPDIWELKKDSAVLYADDDKDLKKMENIFDDSIVEVTIDLDSGHADVINSPKWKETEKSLNSKFAGCVVITQKGTKLEIFSRADIQDDVSSELQNFLAKNAVYKEQFSLSAPVISCLKGFLKSQYDKGLSDLKTDGVNVKITFDGERGAAFLEGTSDGIKKSKSLLRRLQDSIKSENHTIKYRKVRAYLSCSQGNECIKKVETNTPCVIDMGGTGFKSSVRGNHPAALKFEKPTKCAEASFPHNIKVEIFGGDITELSVDVLVNAANKEMKHAGGLAAVISRKGGHTIQKECDDRVKNKGALSEGGVFISTGGNLQCKFVAHAVGPHWHGGNSDEEKTLQRAVSECLEKSEKRKACSIAIPALSAGVFQYPIDKSCMAIVEAIFQYSQKHGKTSHMKTVILCDISQQTVHAFTVALQQVEPNATILMNMSQADGPKPSWVINPEREEEKSSQSGIKIEVVKAILAKEKVDVIVNSASPDLQLKKGALSGAILKAAGDGLQDECTNRYPNGINTGDVAVTGAGKLKCSKVFHIAIKHYDSRQERQSMRGLEQCVTACLNEADQNNFTSLSFPAMGTGAQRYPKDKVAKEMFRTVTKYSKSNPGTSIQRVRFVIYTEDDETFETFITEEKHWSDGSNQGRSHSGGRGHASGSGKLLSESQGKAEFQMGNLKVVMYAGDITDEKTVAIVASCNLDLDLSKGAVTKALLKKGGSAIEQDCKQQKDTMRNEGIAITTAGKLPSKYIIHVETKYKTWEWQPVVLSALRKAEKHKLASVAFPALGTSVGCKPEQVSAMMCAAISEFLNDNPNHLQEIRIVVFQQDMISGFIDGMKNALTGRPKSADRKHRESQGQQRKHGHYRGNEQRKNDEADDACSMKIYAESDHHIKSAKSKFEKYIRDEWRVQKVEDQGVHRLSFEHIKQIKDLAGNSHVFITVDTDLGAIELVGLHNNILDVFNAIHAGIRSADQSFYLRGQAQLMSNIVKWIYIKGNKEYPFPSKVNLEIETAYRKKEKTVKVKDRSGGEYEIDFVKMEEYDVKTPQTRLTIIRRDLVTGASFDIPKTWAKMGETENLKLIQLNQTDPEYQKVSQEFLASLGRNPNIAKIERIQNKTLYTQYSAKRKELNMNNPNKTNERVLWHGTAHNAVQSINAHGFNRSYCGKNATAFGDGVYFAVNSNYSDQSTYSPPGSDGNKRMYRCLVLTGQYTMGAAGMRVPPPINTSQPHILYDSVTNNTGSPGMFIVFNDTQAYPEHLITYK